MSVIVENNLKDFFRYALNRENIRLARLKGQPAPWTNDPILQDFRFCNINREDDVVTKWIRSNITSVGYGNRLLGALIIARWFNRIETLELLKVPEGFTPPYFSHNLFYSWADDLDAWEVKMRERLADQKPLVTAAYMIKTPAKMDKLSGLIWIMRQILPHSQDICNSLYVRLKEGEEGTSLEQFVEMITEYPFFGPFYAYELACDMYQTKGSPLASAPDINSWANPGPGAARGLARLCGEELKHFKRGNKADVVVMNALMRNILHASKNPSNWPSEWTAWDMRTVEHTLCEFDKYERVRLGEGKPKQKFKGKG